MHIIKAHGYLYNNLTKKTRKGSKAYQLEFI